MNTTKSDWNDRYFNDCKKFNDDLGPLKELINGSKIIGVFLDQDGFGFKLDNGKMVNVDINPSMGGKCIDSVVVKIESDPDRPDKMNTPTGLFCSYQYDQTIKFGA